MSVVTHIHTNAACHAKFVSLAMRSTLLKYHRWAPFGIDALTFCCHTMLIHDVVDCSAFHVQMSLGM